jgi:hypothetical protein
MGRIPPRALAQLQQPGEGNDAGLFLKNEPPWNGGR